MKKVKKYNPGAQNLYANTGGWSYGFGGNSGMTNPGNQTLKQTTTVSPSTIPTGSLPTTGNISQVTNPLKKTSSGGGFSDLMGGMDIGGMASQLGGSIAMMINANKKQDPTGKPYKNGTDMIKYQEGTKSAKNIKYILEENKKNAAMNAILVANAANAKRNAELKNKVDSLKSDTAKNNKSKLIKYQKGVSNISDDELEKTVGGQIKYQKTLDDDFNENSATVEKNRNLLGLSKDQEMSPEQLKKFRDYEDKKDIDIAMNRLKQMSLSNEYLTPKKVSLNIPQQTPMSLRPNPVSVSKLSRRERKMENARMETLLKKDDNSIKQISPKEIELLTTRNKAEKARESEEKTLPIRSAAEDARKTYEARLAGESARSSYEEKQKQDSIKSGIPSSLTGPTFNKEAVQKYLEKQAGGPVSTEKNPILYKESFKGKNFKDMTPAQQKQYRAGMASGREFTVEGIGKYGAASKEEQTKSARMAAKSGGAKPLIKMKEKTSTPVVKNTTPQATMTGKEMVLMSRMGKPVNPYAMAGFKTPFNQPVKQSVTGGKKQKPATNIPSPIMDYKDK